MNRRQALRSLALSAGAVSLARWSDAHAADPATQVAPAPPPTKPFSLPALPYAYDALEPFVDAQTMQIHHDKHHAAYVTNLNKALADQPELAAKPVEALLRDLATVPEAIRTAVRNHGGGHANHSLFWTSLRKGGPTQPVGALATAIDRAFGSHAAFLDQWTKAGAGVFGSGWAWLSLDPSRGLVIEGLPNQDSPLMHGREPVVGIDVWEHAYYLKYQNRRPDYLAAIVQVIDWDAAAQRYQRLTHG